MPTKEEFLRQIATGLAERKRQRAEACERALERESDERELAAYLRDKMGSRGKHAVNTPFFQC